MCAACQWNDVAYRPTMVISESPIGALRIRPKASRSEVRHMSQSLAHQPTALNSDPVTLALGQAGDRVRSPRRTALWTVVWVAIAAATAYFLAPRVGEFKDSMHTLQ